MPFLYNVAVKSADHFDSEEPVLFTPVAHSSEQALRLVLRYLWERQPRISTGEIMTTTDQGRRIGGYDDQMVEHFMNTRSGVQ